MNRRAQFSLHPLVAAAAVSLVVVSGLGVAAFMGMLPPTSATTPLPSAARIASTAPLPRHQAATPSPAVPKTADTPSKAPPNQNQSVQAVAKALALDVP